MPRAKQPSASTISREFQALARKIAKLPVEEKEKLWAKMPAVVAAMDEVLLYHLHLALANSQTLTGSLLRSCLGDAARNLELEHKLQKRNRKPINKERDKEIFDKHAENPNHWNYKRLARFYGLTYTAIKQIMHRFRKRQDKANDRFTIRARRPGDR